MTFTPGQILFAAQLEDALSEKVGVDVFGAPNGIATLGPDGKLATAQIPQIAINDVFVIGSQAAMLALTAEKGDVALRTDISKSFILSSNSPGTLADWKEVLVPAGGGVSAVAGKTGAVTLVMADISDSTATGRTVLGVGSIAALTALLNTATTSAKGLCPQLSGDSNQFFNGNGTFSTPSVSSSFPRGYLFPRAIMSNNSTTPLSKIDLAAGVARSSDDTTNLSWGALTLDIATTGANGLDSSGSRASTGTIHVFVIYNPTGPTYAAFGSSSLSPTLPSGYTKSRRVGSIRLLAASPYNLPAFIAKGDMIVFKTSAGQTPTFTNALTGIDVLAAPTGIRVRLDLTIICQTGTGAPTAWVGDGDATAGFSSGLGNLNGVAGATTAATIELWSNTAAQFKGVEYATGGTPSWSMYLAGYLDPRDA